MSLRIINRVPRIRRETEGVRTGVAKRSQIMQAPNQVVGMYMHREPTYNGYISTTK